MARRESVPIRPEWSFRSRQAHYADDNRGAAVSSELTIAWSPIHRAEWDTTPEEYVSAGLVGWGRSRRLARATDPAHFFKAYIGVQHVDPQRWMLPGDARTVYFLSVFVATRTLWLRTYPTLQGALTALDAFHFDLSATDE